MSGLNRRALLGVAAAAASAPRLALAADAPAPAAAPPPPQGAGGYGFRVGDARCRVVSDGMLANDLPVQPALAMNATPEAVADVLAERLLPADRGVLHFNALFVDTGRNRVLIDAGCADSFGPTGGKLLANLRLAGIDPATIDTIIISHAHPDHLFGVLLPDGTPAFPDARVLVSEPEHAFWTGAADLSRARIDDQFRRMLIDGARHHLAAVKDRLELVQPDRELLPGIRSVPTPGHTPGHLSFVLSSGDASLFLTVDVVHHFVLALAHPEWLVSFDTDSEQASATRRRALDQAATDRLPVLAYHFPFPGLGHVARRGGAYAWEPIIWNWDPEAPLA
jgi:glyoxylase-like metal-dependent hydrolase (beta-lactamase superfamily II)